METTDMCLSSSSMCCLCCLSFSLMAKSLHAVSRVPQSINVWCSVGAALGTKVCVLGLLFLTNVELLGGSLTLSEGVAVNTVSTRTMHR